VVTGTQATLAHQLARFATAVELQTSPERMATMVAAVGELKATGIEQRALQVGDAAPRLTLPNALGAPTALWPLWRRGPLVLVFCRGGWCPYCNLALRAWQRELDTLDRLGGSLIAVSPQTPDQALSTAERNRLAYPVLSDSMLLAAAFGVAFTLAPQLVGPYLGVSTDLPMLNGNGHWALPIPATYVIGRGGRILFAHVEADHRARAEPSQVLAAVALAHDGRLS
jgi:peroxiredoxin